MFEALVRQAQLSVLIQTAPVLLVTGVQQVQGSETDKTEQTVRSKQTNICTPAPQSGGNRQAPTNNYRITAEPRV